MAEKGRRKLIRRQVTMSINAASDYMRTPTMENYRDVAEGNVEST